MEERKKHQNLGTIGEEVPLNRSHQIQQLGANVPTRTGSFTTFPESSSRNFRPQIELGARTRVVQLSGQGLELWSEMSGLNFQGPEFRPKV